MKVAVYIPSFSASEINQAQQGTMLRELVDPLIPLLKARVEIVFFTHDGRPGIIADDSYELKHWEENATLSMNSIRMLRHLFSANFLRPNSLSQTSDSETFYKHYDGLYIPSTYCINTNTKQQAITNTLIESFVKAKKPIALSGCSIAFLNNKNLSEHFPAARVAVSSKLVRTLSFFERLSTRFNSTFKEWQITKKHCTNLGYKLIIQKDFIQEGLLLTAPEGTDDKKFGEQFLKSIKETKTANSTK